MADEKKDYDSVYYQQNRERLIQQAREYYYKHRDNYVKYQAEYYQKNKERLNARRRELTKVQSEKKALGRPKRVRTNLSKPNKTDEQETRRKTFEAIRLTPPEPIPQPDPWNPNHTVTFD